MASDPIDTFVAVNESIQALKNRGTMFGRLYNFIGIYDECYAQYYNEDVTSSSSSDGEGEGSACSDSSDDDAGWGIPPSQIEQATDLGEKLCGLRDSFVHSAGGAVRTAPGKRLALVIGGRVLQLCDGVLLSAAAVLPHCTPAAFGDLRARATVVDDSVRLASECRAPAFELVQLPPAAAAGGGGRGMSARGVGVAPRDGPFTPPAILDDIAEAVTAALLPSGFSLRPHKLCVYGPGGLVLQAAR